MSAFACFSPFRWRRLAQVAALAAVAWLLAGCWARESPVNQPGWYLEKTTDTEGRLIYMSRNGDREEWVGKLSDDSPRSSALRPLRPGEDVGLFRWSLPGCTELSFVLSRQDLKCTTCMERTRFVTDSGSCTFDQQRLPVDGWTAIRLPLPR